MGLQTCSEHGRHSVRVTLFVAGSEGKLLLGYWARSWKVKASCCLLMNSSSKVNIVLRWALKTAELLPPLIIH